MKILTKNNKLFAIVRYRAIALFPLQIREFDQMDSLTY